MRSARFGIIKLQVGNGFAIGCADARDLIAEIEALREASAPVMQKYTLDLELEVTALRKENNVLKAALVRVDQQLKEALECLQK